MDGSWGATLRLDENRSYQFRYFDNNGHWHNDWKADAYVPNQFDGDNSVVSATAESSAVAVAAVETGAPKPKRRAPARKAAAKKKPA